MQQVVEFVGNNPVLSLAWVGLLGAVVYTFIQPMLSKVKAVGNHEATLLINKEDAVVVDVRTNDEYNKGYIAGARHIPLTQVQANNFKPIENLKGSPIIVVCETGMRSGSAANALVKGGFEKVYNLRGGMTEWKSANLPITKKK